MFDVTFRDGSEAEFRGSLGTRIPNEFMDDEYDAFSFALLMDQLQPGTIYRFRNYSAVLDVNKKDALFVRMIIEDNFLDVKFSDDAPEVPYRTSNNF
ncbi:MAG: hypothetical protein F2587_02940 [Actinobacteria bacterium]|uniref:Unannotated protein n=1 Tax=freshwater metagenome TaxID=449393 RepID=A0A6J6H3Q9_9ZZZZ|nr:hypothetical protein [Actinomycetota bacterium]